MNEMKRPNEKIRKEYRAPAAEILRFSPCDVICTSKPDENADELPIILF